MHLLIPFAAPLSDAGRQAMKSLALPHLQRLCRDWAELEFDAGDEWSLSPPHERALAREFGWQGGNGLLPWAARAAQADGIDTGDLAWGLLTPTHWHLGTDQISLLDPAALLLDEAASHAFFEAVKPLFVAEGFMLQWGAPQRWYLAHESLAQLPTASLDRVIGRNVDVWLGASPQLRLLRRLQSEVQMQLYTHPENQRREARGLLPVNSFWLSGCGAAQPVPAVEPVVDGRLREPALAEDWAGWAQAWSTLDEGPLAGLRPGPDTRLTLCGERSSLTLAAAPRGLRQMLRSLWSPPAAAATLERL